MNFSLGLIGLYVVLVGIASFAEKPVSGKLDAYRLTAALKVGTLAVAVPALLIAGQWRHASIPAVGAGLGIGLISGIGSAFYCFAVKRTPLDVAATFSNAYVIVTAVLGITILGEPLTVLRVLGLILTIAGIVALSVRGGGTGPHGLGKTVSLLGIYVVVVGVATFLEKPALHYLAPLQLNVLVAAGMVAAGFGALLIFDRSVGWGLPWVEAGGIGALIGLGGVFYYLGLVHLPVSVAATLSDTYILLTVGLGVIFLQERLGWFRIAGIAATVAGIVLVSIGP